MNEILHTSAAPAAIGPYSQAVRAGNLIFCSGQIALDPATGALSAGTMTEQTNLIMTNIQAILATAGATLKNIVRTEIFLADIGDFAEVNAAYGAYFPENPPARSCMQVAALPKGARIEIEVTAAL